jgi:transmembrane sensor
VENKIYNIDELVKDKTFHNWVKKSNPIDIEFWNAYLLSNPQQIELFQTAALMIKGFPVKEKKFSIREVNQFWEQLDENLTVSKKLKVSRSRPSYIYWASAAAVFVGVLFFAVYFLTSETVQTIAYSTLEGEKKEIVLPDHSVVILSSNSTLVYKEPSNKDLPRVVLLNGQAFFSVKHTKDDRKFIVKTLDNLKVEVLGTKFNVSSTCRGTTVVLNSGKIKLGLDHKDQSLTMAPGEMVYVEDKKTFVKKKVNPEIYSAWKDDKLIFEDNSLEEIINVLEYSHGFQVELTDKRLLQKRFTGTFETDKLDVLFAALSNSFNLKYTRHENKVLLIPFKQISKTIN